MGFTVLKTRRILSDQITEVIGEFQTEYEAEKCANDARKADVNEDFDIEVELPPSQKNMPES